MEDVKNALDEIGKAHAEMKAALNKRDDEVLKLGAASAETKERVEKINEHLDVLSEIKSRLDKMELDRTRPNMAEVKTEHMAEFKAAVNKMFRGKGDTSGFAGLEEKGMSVSVDPNGGFTVQGELADGINSLVDETSPIRSIANVVTIGTDRWEEIVNTAGPDSGWVAELGTRAETTAPTFDKIQIPVHEQYAMPALSQKLIDDSSVDILAWLNQRLGIAFAEGENTAFVNGNGVSRPRGFLNYDTITDASWSFGKVGFKATGEAADWASTKPYEILINVKTALKSRYLANATWVMNRTVQSEIRKFTNGTGDMLWAPGLLAGQPNSLLGYPVLEADDMPNKAANAFPIAFGDFRQGYTIVDRKGISVLYDPYTVKGQVLAYTTKRVGGGINNFEAIKLVKIASS